VTARAQILLVDDEANIRRMLAALLREEGLRWRRRPTAAALLQLDDIDPDVVLLDLFMPPGPDGLDHQPASAGRGRARPSS
jgi:CheY-like chemotaxis protein